MSGKRYLVGLLGLGVFGALMNAVDSPWHLLVGFIGGFLYYQLLRPLIRRRTSASASEES